MKGAIVLCWNTHMNPDGKDNSEIRGRGSWNKETVCSLWKRKQMVKPRKLRREIMTVQRREEGSIRKRISRNVNPTFKIATDEPMKDALKKGISLCVVKALIYSRTHGGTAPDFSLLNRFSTISPTCCLSVFLVPGRPTVLCCWGE